MKAILVLGLFLVVSVAHAETSAPVGQLQTGVSSPLSNLHTALETRPSWTVNEVRVHTENEFDLWYTFNPNRQLQYIQYFNTNLFDTAGKDSGVGLDIDAAWLMFKMKNLWTNRAARLSFGYDPTLVLPTAASARSAGKVVELRNTLKLRKEFNNTFYFEFREAPTFFAYTQPGTLASNAYTANPIFQNRVHMFVGANITDKLVFELPLWFLNTRNRDYNSLASNNDAWTHKIMIWPELDYTVNNNLMLGVAYYSDNLVKSDLSDLTLKDGLNKGATQLVVRASL